MVGLPRSGTKLLRDLLNRNPRISIPEEETHFIPYFVRTYGDPPRFIEDRRDLDRFCQELQQSPFTRKIHKRGYTLSVDDLRKKADLRDWASIFEYVLRSSAPGSRDGDFIFGDKTPKYVNAMGLLKGIFPAARFVHIIRDARDCCVSSRKAWGLHPYETADRWQETLQHQRRLGRSMGDYLEIRYEDLITDTEEILRGVCGFLDCDFVPEMLRLAKSNEVLGETRGRAEVVVGNMNKFWSEFSMRQIRRIEEIALDQMLDLGYEVYLAERPRPLSGASRFVLRKRNAFNLLRRKAERQGVKETVRFLLTPETRQV